MNKTLSVNIGGIVFHIEELAYEKLNRYLAAIKGYFTTSDGRDEIMQDIEGRIGEMFQERISNGKQVIVDSDVDQIIDIMGRPDQFADMQEDNSQVVSYPLPADRKTYRKLFRDPDDRVLGGVCSGLSHYLGLDPIWLRALFAIAFFVFGSGLLLYIILVIVMPKANTTAEKLEMKGEQVNITNIKKSVQDEIGSYSTTRVGSGLANIFDGLGQILKAIFRIIGKIIAVLFIIIGVMILVSFILVLFAIMGVGGITIPVFMTDLFMDPWQQSLVLLGAFLVFGIPLIMIIFKAIKVLFKIKVESRILNWSAFALWVAGVIISIGVASSIAGEFRSRETQRTEIPIAQPSSDTLYLDVVKPDKYRDDWEYNSQINDPWSVSSGQDTIRISNVKLDIVKSTSGKFELVQVAAARGADRRHAVENARSMEYRIEQQDSLLKFDESFFIPKGTKYRDQKIQLILKVPEGKSVFLAGNIDNVIYDVENVTNTYDGDMIGKTWTMTSRGLECLGCTPDEISGLHQRSEKIRIRIDQNGVNVEGNEPGNDSGFTIDSKDVDIKINENGVQIESRKESN